MKKKIIINAPIVIAFVTICLAATCLNYITDGFTNQILFSTYHSPLSSVMTYVRFVTHVFGHVDWAHLIANMSYILLLGPLLEEKHGPGKLLLVICISAVITGLVNYIFFWSGALCGASGVCFAFILLASFTSFKDGEIPLSFILVAAIFLGGQIFDALAIQDNVSNLSHILGGIVGAVTGYRFNKKGATGYRC